jgi:hypothetical protein
MQQLRCDRHVPQGVTLTRPASIQAMQSYSIVRAPGGDSFKCSMPEKVDLNWVVQGNCKKISLSAPHADNLLCEGQPLALSPRAMKN